MARLSIILILLVPLIEIAVLIRVGQSIGLWPTLALLVGAGLGGALLLRQQGLATLMRLRADLGAGRMPVGAMADTVMLGLAGLLLVLPGLISDVIAIALLLPPVRNALYRALARRVRVVDPDTMRNGPFAQTRPPLSRPETIELDEDDYRRR